MRPTTHNRHPPEAGDLWQTPDGGHIHLPRRRPFGSALAASVLALFLLAGLFAAVALFGTPATEVSSTAAGPEAPAAVAGRTTPDLLGLSSQEAGLRLRENGLLLGRVRESPSPEPPAGIVLRQRPAAGTVVAEDRPIDIWLSTPLLRAPRLLGLSEIEAGEAAAHTGLPLQVLFEATDEVSPGTVLLQSPPEGVPLEAGDRLVVVVARERQSAGGPAGTPPAVALFARFASIPLLYPPPEEGFELQPASDNPATLTGATGEPGAEIKLVDPTRPGVLVVLTQGNGLDPGLDHAGAVEVRGRRGSLGAGGGETVLTWEERGIRYTLRSTGLSERELRELAERLQPVPTGPGLE